MAKARKPKRKRKEQTLGELKQCCRRLCRKIVFIRDGHRCVRCSRTQGDFYQSGNPVVLQWSHLVRRAQSERLVCEPRNSVVHCSACHKWWETQDKLMTVAWFVGQYGQEHWDWLVSQRKIKETIYKSDWSALRDRLGKELAAITSSD